MAILETSQLTNQVEKLAQVSRDLRRKHKQMQNQMRLICEERSELTAIVQNQQRDITTLQQANAQNMKCAACGAATPDGYEDEDQSSRPTFSVRELRAILHERNELKLKLSKAEEQLQAMQAEPPQPDSGSDTSPSLTSTATVEEDEAPVQGPLPAEPDDAPWKRNSGIRKFFRKLFTESDIAVPLPSPTTRLGRGTAASGSFFASSLLSLISPWAPSRGGRCRPSPARCPRAVAPPPAPRRHSLPPPAAPSKPRRYSDHRKPQASKLDLRQELLNLNDEEVTSWLGDVDERDEVYYGRFEHDIPVQKSISLDRGIEIFNYLQNVGSDWSDSSDASSWTVYSERERLIEQDRSFEDIPASQMLKSRRSSFDVYDSLTLTGSYRSIDEASSSDSPQIKKLQRNISFRISFEDFKSVEDSNENLNASYRRVRVPLDRSISLESADTNENKEGNRSVRQRKFGIQSNIEYHLNLRKEVLKQNWYNFKSCENLSVKKVSKHRRGSADYKTENSLGFTLLKDSYKAEFSSGNISPAIIKLKKSFSFVNSPEISRNAPVITVTDFDSPNSSIAKNASTSNLGVNTSSLVTQTSYFEGNLFTELKAFELVDDTLNFSVTTSESEVDASNLGVNTSDLSVRSSSIVGSSSSLVDISSTCNCRMCREGEDRTPFLTRNLTKIFMKIISRRKLICSDENNNLNEGEMYSCVMQVLKLLFGLWLRHLDHN
uniref:RH2 domain-containing protein n=1 Tax=Pectinophora gossypiella TaxID=13191 RepID=A0A1E1W6Q4_PECGO